MQSKAAFLDRDGVINEDSGYVYCIADFKFIDGVFEACRCLHQLSYKLIVVTNQSGIARGFYTEEDFHTVNNWMKMEFDRQHAPLTAVYYCPYLADAKEERYRQDSPYRKPGPQMLLDAAVEHNIDLQASFMVGDKLSDLAAARAAGVPQSFFIGEQSRLSEEYKRTPVFESLYHLVQSQFAEKK